MTAKTSDFSSLLFYNPAGPGFNAVESANISCSSTMNEGDTITVNLVTWAIPDGTVLAHTFPLTNISPLRFNISPISPVANNRASFFIAVNSDNTTASGAQSFDIQIRKTVTSDVLATKTVTINDTSQDPVVPSSLAFNGSDNYIEVTGTLSDWALGTTWTIEWWSKATSASTGGGTIYTVMSQYDNLGGIGIDIYYQNTKLVINNGQTLADEPTPGVWTHVAVINNAGSTKLYYNGIEVITAGYNNNLGLSTATLVLGRRGQIPYQYFNGKLTGIRITNTLVYTDTFDPYTIALPPAKVTGTKLLLNPTNITTLDDLSDSNHGLAASIGNNSDYPIGPLTANVTGWNPVSGWLLPDVAGNPDLTPVVSGWTVTGPLGFTATVIGSPFSNGTNWVITVNASLAGFTESNVGNYTFTPP
jgi:hypothetical protein